MSKSKLIYIWNNRFAKFRDNPYAIFPFLKKHLYYKFIADRFIPYYRDFTFLSYNETLRDAMSSNKTIIRFGDEIFDMIHGIGLYFNDWRQKYDPAIAEKLKEILNTRDSRILLCFNPELIFKSKTEFVKEGIPEQWQFWVNSKVFLKNFIEKTQKYGSALCFNPQYNTEIPYKELGDYFRTKDIIIVASNGDRFSHIDLGKTTSFIEAPKSDAWDSYDEIKYKILSHIQKNNLQKDNLLLLLSISTAGKVLAYELTLQGYTSWDTGQFFDLAYNEIKNINS